MKKAKRNTAAVKDHRDIESIVLSKDCPGSGSNFVAWLKLQNQKLEYRLLYCDLMVCISFIILIFTALRFQASVVPNRWFFALVILMLIACCIMFIGVHLLQHREADLKVQAKYGVVDWTKYRTQILRWPTVFGTYSFLLLALGCLHFCSDDTPSPLICTGLLVLTTLLFAVGMMILVSTIRAKENTRIYVLQAARRIKM